MKALCIWEQKQTDYSGMCNDWANRPKQKDKLCFCVTHRKVPLAQLHGRTEDSETSGRVHHVTASLKIYCAHQDMQCENSED
jgi:hypothetical protein